MPNSAPPSLLELIRNGDIAAFETLFREYHAPLCDYVNGMVKSPAVAEDIVQDLFFAFWVKRQSLSVTSLRGYLFAAARNRALHVTRHDAFRSRVLRFRGGTPELAGIADAVEPADRMVEQDEVRTELASAIAKLPPRSRRALSLQWRHDLTQAEIAGRLGISIKGVEKLLATARRLLRFSLRQHAPAGSDKRAGGEVG